MTTTPPTPTDDFTRGEWCLLLVVMPIAFLAVVGAFWATAHHYGFVWVFPVIGIPALGVGIKIIDNQVDRQKAAASPSHDT